MILSLLVFTPKPFLASDVEQQKIEFFTAANKDDDQAVPRVPIQCFTQQARCCAGHSSCNDLSHFKTHTDLGTPQLYKQYGLQTAYISHACCSLLPCVHVTLYISLACGRADAAHVTAAQVVAHKPNQVLSAGAFGLKRLSWAGGLSVIRPKSRQPLP